MDPMCGLEHWVKIMAPTHSAPLYVSQSICPGTRRHGRKRSRTASAHHPGPRKQRRRTEADAKATVKLPQIIVPWSNPLHTTALELLERDLPVECRVQFGGMWHPFVLCGVMYRYGKLAWIMINRLNLQLCVSAHWGADCSHLYESTRDRLTLGLTERNRKWRRQSFNQACLVFRSEQEYSRNVGLKLSDLPDWVLQAPKTDYLRVAARDYVTIRSKGSTDSLRPLHALTETAAAQTKGWRRFALTDPLSGSCALGKRKTCPCADFAACIRTGSSHEQAVEQIVRAPFSAAHTGELLRVYSPLIATMRANPSTRFFKDCRWL